MADYEEKGRSNYVRYDRAKRLAVETLFPSLNCLPHSEGVEHGHVFYGEDYNPSFSWSDQSATADDEDFNDIAEALTTLGLPHDDCEFLDVVAKALLPEDGNIFLWMCIGSEKMRYVSGGALAMDHTGQILKQVSLSDVYVGLPADVSRAEY